MLVLLISIGIISLVYGLCSYFIAYKMYKNSRMLRLIAIVLLIGTLNLLFSFNIFYDYLWFYINGIETHKD